MPDVHNGNIYGSSIIIFMTGTGTNHISSELPKITAVKLLLLLGCQQEVDNND